MLMERSKVHVAGRRGYSATELAPEGALHVAVRESPLLTELANKRHALILNKLTAATPLRGPVLNTYEMARSYLGVPIIAGLAVSNLAMVIEGAVPVALLALLVDHAVGVVGRVGRKP